MTTLYVTEPGSTVRLSGGSLIVTADEHARTDGDQGAPKRIILLEVEPHRLELIALIGKCHITLDAMHLCLDQGISVAWLNHGGELLGRTVPVMHRSAGLRLHQYQCACDPGSRSARAKTVVDAKISNALAVLRDILSNDPCNDDLNLAIAALRRHRDEAAACNCVQTLLGFEGAAARTYFHAYGISFKGEIGFSGRHYRPAPDPANALMSFGYVLVTNRIGGLLEAHGLDPSLGFFHELRSGRPSLALDLLEELRHPVVDRFVLRCCNLNIFRMKHFEPPDPEKGVRLTHDGLKLFFTHWEEHLLRPIREKNAQERLSSMDVIQRQVERMAASFHGDKTYSPFRYGD